MRFRCRRWTLAEITIRKDRVGADTLRGVLHTIGRSAVVLDEALEARNGDTRLDSVELIPTVEQLELRLSRATPCGGFNPFLSMSSPSSRLVGRHQREQVGGGMDGKNVAPGFGVGLRWWAWVALRFALHTCPSRDVRSRWRGRSDSNRWRGELPGPCAANRPPPESRAPPDAGGVLLLGVARRSILRGRPRRVLATAADPAGGRPALDPGLTSSRSRCGSSGRVIGRAGSRRARIQPARVGRFLTIPSSCEVAEREALSCHEALRSQKSGTSCWGASGLTGHPIKSVFRVCRSKQSTTGGN